MIRRHNWRFVVLVSAWIPILVIGPKANSDPNQTTPSGTQAAQSTAPSTQTMVGEGSTDALLPSIFESSPIPIGHGVLVGGAVDVRTRDSTSGRTQGVWVNEAEIDIQHAISKNNNSVGAIVFQLIAEDPPDIKDGRDVQVGEAYVLYRLPIHSDYGTTSYIKVGQFQIPFGLLATYDPHLDIVQSLYPEALGLRNDWGASLTGQFYGYLQYDLSLTTGTGPNHVVADPNRLVSFRLGRSFATRYGSVTIGGSLLSGRLPVTDPYWADPTALELPPSGRNRPYRLDFAGESYTPKTRIAGDLTYKYRALMSRGEAVYGADKDQRVLGYFAEGNYAVARRLSLLLSSLYWLYATPNSSSSIVSAGASYNLSSSASLSAIFEYHHDLPRSAASQVDRRATLQMVFRF